LRTNRFPLAALAAFVLTALGFAGCNDTNGKGPAGDDQTAATVNGVAIPVARIDRLIDQQLKAGGPNTPQLTPVALAAARLQVLDQLIQEEALFQRAQKENLIPTDDEVKQALQTQIQQSGMSQDDFQKRLKDFGQTEDELKTDLKRQLAIQKLQAKVTATIPAPTEAEMKKFFDENQAQMTAPRGVELSDIVVDPANNGGGPEDAVGAEAAMRKATEIVTQLRGGADFATVARVRSEDASGAQGGLVGFFSEAQLQQTFPADVATRLFAMQPGQIMDPITGQAGRLHIFKLNGKRESQQNMTYDQVKAQIAQTITDQRKQVVLSALLVDAVAAANVVNNLASQIVAHPDTFGALRPSPLTQPRPDAQPAPQSPAPVQPAPQPEAQPGAPVNGNANANANTNANANAK
jgi:parvulin-like peptidyl-prolyl isomerase